MERISSVGSYLDVLERVLDKGMVIDAWMRVTVGGIDLIDMKATVVVASIDTHLVHANALEGLSVVSPTRLVKGRTRKPAA